MARQAIDTSKFDSKIKEKSTQEALADLKLKTFAELNESERMLLLKVLAENAGMVKTA